MELEKEGDKDWNGGSGQWGVEKIQTQEMDTCVGVRAGPPAAVCVWRMASRRHWKEKQSFFFLS